MDFQNRQGAIVGLADFLLADVTLRIQLSLSQHKKAVERYESIANWIERSSSPLAGRVARFYPQGSMAIGATISSQTDAEDYDIDVMVEIDDRGETPEQILNLLYESVRGEPGSQYYDVTERKTRCVTVHYKEMHLDLTPCFLKPNREPRTSQIFHHKPNSLSEPTYRTLADPYGFANAYNNATPIDYDLTEAFIGLARKREGYAVLAEAEAEPAPEREPITDKSKALLVLQLTKRWRNRQYENRDCRRPPSPLLARLNMDAANQAATLSQELEHQILFLLASFEQAHGDDDLIRVVNPTCEEDVFSDRWPGSLRAQGQFISDLRKFAAATKRLQEPGCDLPEMRDIIAFLFGEEPANAAVKSFNDAHGQTVQSGRIATDQQGRINLAASGLMITGPAIVTPREVSAAPKPTFYGGRWIPK